MFCSVTLLLVPSRQDLSLNLKLSCWPASPQGSPVFSQCWVIGMCCHIQLFMEFSHPNSDPHAYTVGALTHHLCSPHQSTFLSAPLAWEDRVWLRMFHEGLGQTCHFKLCIITHRCFALSPPLLIPSDACNNATRSSQLKQNFLCLTLLPHLLTIQGLSFPFSPLSCFLIGCTWLWEVTFRPCPQCAKTVSLQDICANQSQSLALTDITVEPHLFQFSLMFLPSQTLSCPNLNDNNCY